MNLATNLPELSERELKYLFHDSLTKYLNQHTIRLWTDISGLMAGLSETIFEIALNKKYTGFITRSPEDDSIGIDKVISKAIVPLKIKGNKIQVEIVWYGTND